MKLTQRQLATLARVSTPTISRFEQSAKDIQAEKGTKDIQLKSVLAILAQLGMTDSRTLVFPDRATKYDSGEGVTFWGMDGAKRVRCRISREALDDHFSEGDRLRPEAAFRKYRPEIEALARRKYLLGRIEPDGAILIRTLEVA
jgi:hypothetical protein